MSSKTYFIPMLAKNIGPKNIYELTSIFSLMYLESGRLQRSIPGYIRAGNIRYSEVVVGDISHGKAERKTHYRDSAMVRRALVDLLEDKVYRDAYGSAEGYVQKRISRTLPTLLELEVLEAYYKGRTIIPITSSMIAAPVITVPILVSSLPSSFRVSTVMLTEVAVSMVPIKSALKNSSVRWLKSRRSRRVKQRSSDKRYKNAHAGGD